MKDDFTPFNGNFVGSDGSIRNLDELIGGTDGQSGSSGSVSMTQVQNAINAALAPVNDALSGKANTADIPDVSGFLTSIPHASATEVGGIKVRVDGNKLYITTDGTNP